MTITYQVKQSVYVNLTNRCPCACRFCLRNNGPEVFGSGPLWLEREPTLEEVTASLDGWDYARFREVVFCGYGEPTERLDVLLAAADHFFAGKVDCLSISLNTDDAAEYLDLCRPKFGAAAYPALLAFTREASAVVPEVVMTVVDEPVTSIEKQARCRALAESLGARLRVRRYEAPSGNH